MLSPSSNPVGDTSSPRASVSTSSLLKNESMAGSPGWTEV